MAKTKDVSTAAAKFARNAGGRSVDYADGIQNVGAAAFEAAAKAGEQNWQIGIQNAIAAKAREKGLQGAGEKYMRNALGKGQSNYASGVAAAEGDYAKGVAPYTATLQALVLPPKGPKGDPKNIERVRAVATALSNKKRGK